MKTPANKSNKSLTWTDLGGPLPGCLCHVTEGSMPSDAEGKLVMISLSARIHVFFLGSDSEGKKAVLCHHLVVSAGTSATMHRWPLRWSWHPKEKRMHFDVTEVQQRKCDRYRSRTITGLPLPLTLTPWQCWWGEEVERTSGKLVNYLRSWNLIASETAGSEPEERRDRRGRSRLRKLCCLFCFWKQGTIRGFGEMKSRFLEYFAMWFSILFVT